MDRLKGKFSFMIFFFINFTIYKIYFCNFLFSKCNPEMVELLPLDQAEDIDYVKQLLEEFVEKTESLIAQDLLQIWPEPTTRFVKVFPYDYQRALKQMEEQKENELIINGNTDSDSTVKDIEDSVPDSEMEQRKLDKIKYVYYLIIRKFKKKLTLFCFLRGFMKYEREKMNYRQAEKRVNDWEEIYNFQGVRKGLKVQAARCMECGVPFCQSSHGCPLGNIIPKWNDLVFQSNWKEALNQLLQTNNFPGNFNFHLI